MSGKRSELSLAAAGDLALLMERGERPRIIRIEPGRTLESHKGILPHDDLIGKPWGSEVTTHLGHPYLMVRPSLHDRVINLRRISQIIYPKEAGYILLKMNIGPGARVLEAGSGSGGLTIVLANAVGPGGRVYSYEVRQDMLQMARRNVEQEGLGDRVVFRLRDAAEGFDEVDLDALFLDLPSPWDYLPQAHAALVNGGFFGAIVPTTNQVSRLLTALHRASFGLLEVEEILLRPYKPIPTRLRPTDQMVAHTGFLVFARALIASDESEGDDS
jgi:tRNA (adenine57-N1/adenine58-N1)-methyltransferase